ncbi:hypothetical protein ICN42_06205, partial [Polynucleobacter sp. 71A-WALBACH]|uniref:VCBS domain-containing protein n=1 Tax=Polynucleobacter sp. 71A-WALBACH TaxID=2689097 RepID=UPI001C0C1F64
MADNPVNAPTTQQVNDAQHLDNMTSLQQPSSAEQSPIAQNSEVKGDAPVANSPTPTPDSPSLFNDPKNPNNKVVEVDPEITGDEVEKNSSGENSGDQAGRGSEDLNNFRVGTGNSNLTVQANGEASEGDAAPEATQSANASSNNSDNQGSSGGGGIPRGVKAKAGTAEATSPASSTSQPNTPSSSQALESAGSTEVAPPTNSPQTSNVVTPQAQFIPDKATAEVNRIASVGSQSTEVTEGDAPFALNTSGKITVVDADAGEALVQSQSNVRGSYGNFSIDANGNWTFTANSAYNELAAGQRLSESFTVTSLDGSGTGVVTVTITGTNDAAAITGTSTASLTETNAALTASGSLSATDVDSSAAFVAQTAVTGSNGYGAFSIDTAGAWSYTASTAHNEFVAGQNYTDSITVATADGTTQVITVTITGTNDAAAITGTSTASLTETNAALTASGSLSATDVDSSAAF